MQSSVRTIVKWNHGKIRFWNVVCFFSLLAKTCLSLVGLTKLIEVEEIYYKNSENPIGQKGNPRHPHENYAYLWRSTYLTTMDVLESACVPSDWSITVGKSSGLFNGILFCVLKGHNHYCTSCFHLLGSYSAFSMILLFPLSWRSCVQPPGGGYFPNKMTGVLDVPYRGLNLWIGAA